MSLSFVSSSESILSAKMKATDTKLFNKCRTSKVSFRLTRISYKRILNILHLMLGNQAKDNPTLARKSSKLLIFIFWNRIFLLRTCSSNPFFYFFDWSQIWKIIFWNTIINMHWFLFFESKFWMNKIVIKNIIKILLGKYWALKNIQKKNKFYKESYLYFYLR